MKTIKLTMCGLALAGAAAIAQTTVAPSMLLQPLGESWPMHNGDYSGRRFSPLSTIDASNVSSLTRAWVYRPDAGNAPAGGGGKTSVLIKGTPVVVNGVLYVTIPDHVWAVDARSGKEIWHATWPSKGGWHIGNRGVAVLGSTVYVETPDCNLVALDAADGREKWRTEICDLEQFYYASAAPLIVKQPRDRRRERRRPRHPRLHRGARSRNRRAAVALVRVSRAWHAGSEDVADRSKRRRTAAA